MAKTEKQEEVLQEVNTDVKSEETPVEQSKQEEPKIKVRILEEGDDFKLKAREPKAKEEKSQEQTGLEKAVKKEDEEKIVKEENEEKKTEDLVLEEVTQEEIAEAEKAEVETIVEEKPIEQKQPEVVVPENLQDLVKFMEETGGGLEDYTRLNADYSTIDDNALLREYYKNTKPHLDMEEINFLIEDNFQVDEDIDEPRDIKKKKLAFKEEIARAKKHLTGLKDQYYKEVKLGSKLTREQQEAVSFYNKYSQEQETLGKAQKASAEHFKNATDNVFNQNFKGFDFNVGEKTYRFKVSDVQSTRQYQSDILNFVSEYVDENNMMNDAKGYHKALYAAKNIDKIVKHFYDQGKADAIKETTMKAKNIDMSPRSATPTVDASGFKVKVLSGDDSSRLKFKIRNK